MKKRLIFLLTIGSILTLSSQSSNNDFDLLYSEKINPIKGITESQKQAIQTASNDSKNKIAQITEKVYALWGNDIYTELNEQDSTIKDDFLSYHFNVYSNDNLNNIIPDIDKNLALLSKKESLLSVIDVIASFEAIRLCKSRLVTRYEQEVVEMIQNTMTKIIVTELQTKINNNQTLAENNNFLDRVAIQKHITI